MARLREDGRPQAWAMFHQKLMLSSHLLIEGGMASPKDITSMLLDVETFRKNEGGSQLLPGDAIAAWLAGEDILKAEKPKPKSKAVN